MGRSGNDGLIYLKTRHEGPPKPKRRPVDGVRKSYRRDGGLLSLHPGWVGLVLALGVPALFLLVWLG